MTNEVNTIQQSILVSASRAQVFRALTDPKTLMKWFPSEAQTDLRSGGKYRFVFKNLDPQHGGQQEGEFLAVHPNEQVSYTWEAGGKTTRVDFTLSESDGGTQVSLTHAGFGEGEAGGQVSKMHAGVWNIYLNNLKSFIEDGMDRRSEMLGQIVE